MSAREQVLAAVRRALGDHDHESGRRVESAMRSTRTQGKDLLDLFTERVEDYQATVVRCSAADVEPEIARALNGKSVIVPAGFPWVVLNSVREASQSAAELDRIEAVVTAARIGIALTGTIVLDHQSDQGRRALSLVPDTHICVVRAEQVVAGLPEAFRRLDPARPTTWISGPSATSDIELSRVEGVHGPRTLRVILIVG